MNFCIVGAGAWGTAMAVHLSGLGHAVTLVARRVEHALDIASKRENHAYLPGITLDNDLQIAFELKPALMEAEVVIMACPSTSLREQCERVQEALNSAWQIKLFISLCKGLEQKTSLLPTEVIREVIPGYRYGVLSGPTFADEIVRGKPAAIVFASDAESDLVTTVQEVMSNNALRVYTASDLRGVELGGCLKNVYAIAVGICDGLNLGDNAKAALLTRALHEVVTLGVQLGGKRESFYGLSGVGDLVSTCTSEHSRNRALGKLVATQTEGERLKSLEGVTLEGYWATGCFLNLCEKYDIEAPILREIYSILYQSKDPLEGLHDLMQRDLRAEDQ